METKKRAFPFQDYRFFPELAAFFTALLSGVLTHGMGLWNKFSWHDDIFALFTEGSTISSGRWMLHVVAWLETFLFGDGHFSLPAVNGLTAIFCIASAAALLVHLLEIRGAAGCAGLGALMVAFPTVTGLFGYMFTVHYYMLAMIMTVAGACLICTGRKWWMKVPAVLLAGCAMGVYQAFFPMLLSILLLYDLARTAEKEDTGIAFLKRLLGQLVCVLAVAGFYFAMNRFFLQKYQLQTNTYMGMNEMNSTPLAEYLKRTGTAYREFLRPSRNVSADMYPMHAYYLYAAMLVGDLLLGAGLGISLWKKSRVKALLFLLLLALFPLANNFIYVMSDRVHGLMTYSLVMQTALFVWLTDRAGFLNSARVPALRLVRRAVSGAAAVILALTGIMYARFDNQCYLKTALQQQQAISFFTALSAQIKSVPGFREDMPVVFLNEQNISDQTLYHIEELDFIHLEPYGDDIEGYVNSYAWRYFMERWCGFSPVWGDPAAYAELQEVKEMPHYPDDGSIRQTEDVLLVNF